MLGDENIVMLEQVWHIELLRCLNSHILQVTSCQLEVFIGGFVTSQEAQLVLFEWSHDCLKQLSLRVLELLRVNEDESIFKQLCREHHFQGKQALLVVDREFE